MKFFVVALIALTAFVVADVDICGTTGSWADSDFVSLCANIKAQSFDKDRVAILATAVANTTLGFNGTQMATLLSLYSFSSSMIDVINIAGLYSLSLSCANMVLILNQFSFSSDKITCLKTIAPLLILDDLKVNNQTIINAFSFSSDKQTAADILSRVKGISCVYGPVREPVVQFLVDVSGSMSGQFTLNGQTYTKISYIQHELIQVIQSLSPKQQFNIYQFSSSVIMWQPGVRYANASSIASATQWVSKLSANGGTNAYSALQMAFSDPSSLAIYFLTDGDPDNGPAPILNALPGWEKARPAPIPVYSIAFGATATAKTFMQQVATITGGVYRSIG